MDVPADPTSIGIILGTAVAAFLVFLFRYRAKMPEAASTSIHGAAIIDSSEVRALRDTLVSLTETQHEAGKYSERQAIALEHISQFLVERDRREQEAELDKLRRENDALRRKTRQQQ